MSTDLQVDLKIDLRSLLAEYNDLPLALQADTIEAVARELHEQLAGKFQGSDPTTFKPLSDATLEQAYQIAARFVFEADPFDPANPNVYIYPDDTLEVVLTGHTSPSRKGWIMRLTHPTKRKDISEKYKFNSRNMLRLAGLLGDKEA